MFSLFFQGEHPGQSGRHIPLSVQLSGSTSVSAIASALSTPEASVTTDQDDYAPGSTATITASGFDEGATVTFEVDHVDGPGDDGVYGTADDVVIELGGNGHEPWSVTDGGDGDLDGEANGTVVTTWFVDPDDSLDERFLVTATDGNSTASNTFTDARSPGSPTVDLADAPNQGEVNGAWFSNDAVGAGTGLIDSFVRINTNKSTEKGYNTSSRPLEFDENSSPGFTRDLLLQDIPVVYKDFGSGLEAYLEFQLDINEPKTGAGRFLSLDEIEIYVSDTPVPDPTSHPTYPSLGTKVYELDAPGGTDNWIALDYSLQSGSGVSDMIMYVPLANFADFEPDDYVTLYSEFGYQGVLFDAGGIRFDFRNNSGFEEWAVREFALKSGYKFHDLNADGVWDKDGVDNIAGNADDEVGLPGWTIYIDANGNNMLDAGETSVVTNADGFYQFSLFEEGTYTFREVVKDGWVQSAPTGGEYTERLGGGDRSFDNNFGNYMPAKIQGVKFEDLDGDGEADAGDTGPVAGIVINLYDDSGSVSGDLDGGDVLLDSTVTAADGTWSFGDLDPGTYNVEEVLSGTGYKSNDDTDFNVTLISNQTYGVNDDTTFLNYRPAKIQGVKLFDVNGNGLEDAEDVTPISGILIELYDDAGSVSGALDGGDVLLDSTVTAADGTWSFSDLDPGTYNVREVLSGGYLSNDDTEFNVTLISNQTYGVNADTTFLNFLPDPSGQSPGFWRNHIDIYDQELFQFDDTQFGDPDETPPPERASEQHYKDVFGVNLTGSLNSIDLEGALNLGGGGENAVIRHSAAALANAASDDLNYTYAGFAAGAIRDTLELIDLDDDTIIEVPELINAVQDFYDDADASTDYFDFGDAGAITNALDAMNNLPHIMPEDFM